MEKNDVELIQRVLSGDENAFSILVKRYQKGEKIPKRCSRACVAENRGLPYR